MLYSLYLFIFHSDDKRNLSVCRPRYSSMQHLRPSLKPFISQACLFSADLRVSASTESKPLPPEMTFLTKFQLNRNAYVILSLSNCSQKRFQSPHIALKIDSFQGLSAPEPRLLAYSAPKPPAAV